MADVKWIKIYTGMVNNKKIKRIRTLPEGNNIILIWVFLLAQAGESNKNGALYLTDTIPFRAEDLAVEFDFEISVIKLAIITLEKFSMIEVFEEIIYIKNWEEYQNIDGLEKIRIQNRERKRKERSNKQLLLEGKEMSRDSHANVTHGHATDIDIDKDKDKEIDNTIILQPYESEFISILQSLRDYPLDRVKDLEMLKTLEQRYPTLDIVESLKDWYIYKQDKPLKEKDNPRLQINTWCKKAIQYGKNIKVEPKPTFAKKVIR